MKKVIFAGDLYIGQGSKVQIGKEIISLFQNSDYSIVNLEAPFITNNSTVHSKAGPNLFQCHSALELLDSLNVKFIGGANNHIYDYGKDGLIQTEKVLQENSIKYNGFGEDLKKAGQAIKFDDSNICYISTCEEEFGIADRTGAGAFSMYGKEIIKKIKQQKNVGNTVIIFAHGGGEEIPIPSEYIMNRYKEFIDSGADIIVGHHPHVPQGYEVYKDKYIFYSLGNFVHNSFNKCWGLLLSVEFDDKRMINFEIIPICLKKSKLSICKNKNKYISILELLSKIYKNRIIAKKLLQEQSIFMYNAYYKKYLTGLFTKGKDKNNIFNDQLLLLHLFRNKSHSEFITKALEITSGEIKDVRSMVSALLYRQLVRKVSNI